VQIKDPIAHEGIFVIVGACDDRPLMPGGGGEPEESAESRRHPQITETVFEQIMKVFVRQAILSAVSRGGSVWPAAIQTGGRANPQRPVTVFHKRIDETRQWVIGWQAHVHQD